MLDFFVEYFLNVIERKNVIRLLLDIVMVVIRSGVIIWSCVFIFRIRKYMIICKFVVYRIFKKVWNWMKNCCIIIIWNGIFGVKMRVRKCMELFKSLVLGGELIYDKDYLIREIFDYIVYF